MKASAKCINVNVNNRLKNTDCNVVKKRNPRNEPKCLMKCPVTFLTVMYSMLYLSNFYCRIFSVLKLFFTVYCFIVEFTQIL